jgi:hypothetical protein
MIRSLPVVTLAVLLVVGCSSSRSASRIPPVDPVTEPTIVGAVGEAVAQSSEDGAAAAQTGHRAGVAAGIFAAVFGGPESESVGEMIDRYRRTRDTIEATSAIIGATKGAVEGAKRGWDLDLQFAELHEIEGVTVYRPFPDQIEVRFASAPSRAMLADVAAVFTRHEERTVDIEAPGSEALDIRDTLIEFGMLSSSISAQRNNALTEVALHVYPSR